MADGQETGGTERTAEPRGMSWFVIAFMTLCLLMTAATIYYAWRVFDSAV